MFGSRVLKQYKDTEVPGPEPCIIHKTFEPISETEERVRFDVRSVGRAAHMSSTVSLIRTVKGHLAQHSFVPERFTMKAGDGRHERKFYGVSVDIENRALRMPGFTLQGNLERVNFSFNAGDCTTGTKWVAPYAKLYRKSMTPFVRNSGGSISNQNDQIHRAGWHMTHNAYVPVGDEKKYITGDITYCNPERNDRHVPGTLIPNTVNIHDDYPKVYWYGQPHDIPPTIMEEPDEMSHDLKRNALFRPVTANYYGTLPPDFNYEITVDGQPHILNSDYALTSDEFQLFYETYWKAEDEATFEQFEALRTELYHDGILLEESNSNHIKWGYMKAMYVEIFQTLTQAQNAPGGDDSFEWEDTLHNWGVDLRKPFYDYQPTQPGVNSSKKFLLKTATHMLQFADEIQRWRAMHLRHTDEIEILRELTARLDVLNASIKDDQDGTDPGVIYTADLLLTRMDENDEKSTEYLEAQEEFNEVKFFLDYYKLPHEWIDAEEESGAVSDSDDVLDLTEQVELMIIDKQAEIDTALGVFRDNFRMFHHWEDTTENRDWIFALQIMSRLWSWMNKDTNKIAKTSDVHDALLAVEHTFVEPVMCGPCKPSEYSSFGCYAGNSNIIPHIERFQLDLQYRKGAKYFELDWYRETHTDMWTGEKSHPTINVTDWSSRLHCTFVEKPVPLPATVPYIDVRTETLSILELQKGVPKVIEFQDMEIRRKFKYLMVYCRRVSEVKPSDSQKKNIDSDKSASISEIQLGTDVQQRCLEADGTYIIDSITRRNFPEYRAPIYRTGNIFAICFNELPQRKGVDGINHLHGKVTIIQDWAHVVEVEVCMSFFNTDTMFEITEHHARKQMNLSAV